ncbi:hypothetical protein BH18CHL1_BH18CHL1_03950 [soil metagenome]
MPLRDLVNKFAHSRFEPAGFTGNQEIPIAKSIVDYVFRWMGSRFLSRKEREALGIISPASIVEELPAGSAAGPSDPSGGAPLRGTTGATTSGSEAAASPNPPHGPDSPAASDLASDHTQASAPSPAPGTVPPGDTRPTSVAVQPDRAPDLPVLGNGNGHAANGNGNGHSSAVAAITASLGAGQRVAFSVSADSPSCAECGSIMVRNGSCYKCLNCGSTSGCS